MGRGAEPPQWVTIDLAAIRFHSEAVADLEHARDWYERQRSGLGVDFLRALEQVVELISLHPEGFPELAPGLRRALLNRFPYAVYYRLGEGTVDVLACLHNRRSSSRWRTRK